jgi:hypothetical protein
MRSEAEVVKLYPETRLVVGDWSLYSKQIAMDSLFPYPLMFRSTTDFADSENKARMMSKPPIFMATGVELNPAQIRYSFHTVKVEVVGTVADSLVIKQNNYPKWYAELDGKPISIYTAVGSFISVPVPPGKHEVVVRYRNTLILPMLLFEFILLSVIVIALFLTMKHQRIRYIFP